MTIQNLATIDPGQIKPQPISKSAHIHTYQRIRKRPQYYRCVHPDCSHYTHKELLLGKRARCPFCGESYIIDWLTLRLAKPHCPNCTRSNGKLPKKQEKILHDGLKKFFESVAPILPEIK